MHGAGRNGSLVKFVLVYLLITAIPVAITYQIAQQSSRDPQPLPVSDDQQTLAADMTALQAYIRGIETIDARRPAERAPRAVWTAWLQQAASQNAAFRKQIDLFKQKPGVSGHLLTIRNNACSYLYRVCSERDYTLAKQTGLLNRRRFRRIRT